MDFNPDQYESNAAVADGANKLLMLVLVALIKAGASHEHEMLAEIQGTVFSFIPKMENRAAMDTMLVSRVRILYIRSLFSRAPELQSLIAGLYRKKEMHITPALAGATYRKVLGKGRIWIWTW